MQFNSEKAMSECFNEFLIEFLTEENVELVGELKGLFGRPDYVILETNNYNLNYVISLELKLKNWRQALKQAFKYRNFSNESFVIMDEGSVNNVLQYKYEFTKYNIGLGSFNENKELRIYHYPEPSTPFSHYLISKMKDKVFDKKIQNSIHYENEPCLNCDSKCSNFLRIKLMEACSA